MLRRVCLMLVVLLVCAAWAGSSMAADDPVADRIARVIQMTPLEMAQTSKAVVASYNGILAAAEDIQNPAYRATVLDLLKNPSPTFLGGPAMDSKSFLAAAGAGGHHTYPGGLPIHTYANLQHALNILATYERSFGAGYDRDLVVASVLLHDVLKAYTHQMYPEFNTANGKWLSPKEVAADGLYKAWGRYALMGHHNEMLVSELAFREAPAILVATAHSHQDQFWDSRANAWLQDKDETWERTMEDGLKKLALFPGGREKSERYLAEVMKPEYKTIEAGINLLADSDWNLSQGKATPHATRVFGAFAAKHGLAKDSKEYNLAQGWLFARVEPLRIVAELEAARWDVDPAVKFIESVFADPTEYEVPASECKSVSR